MVATKGQAIALGVVSILTIGGGIAVIVLFKYTFEAMASSFNFNYPVVASFWAYGVPILFTGVMGLVAAGARNNVAVGLFMAAGIICLIIEAAFLIIAALVLLYLSCGLSSLSSSLTYLSCESSGVVGLSKATVAVIIVSWLLMLAGTIMSCVACCCGKRDAGQPGTIIVTGQPSTTVVVGSPGYEMQSTGGGYPQYPQYSQPGQYDPGPIVTKY